MAGKFVGEAEELIESPEATPFSRDGTRTYRKQFRIIANVMNVDPIEACLAPGVPRQWSPYYSFDTRVYDTLALCHTISAKREASDDWQAWIVTCEYSTEMPNNEIPSDQQSGNDPSNNNTGSNNNPERETPEYEWDAEEEHVAIPHDLEGKVFVNSALQPFKPAPTIRVVSPIFVMTRNENNLAREELSKYAFATNTDNFMGAPPGFCLSYAVKARMQFKGLIRYWRATYRIKFHWSLDPDNPRLKDVWELVVKPGQLNGNLLVKKVFGPFQTKLLDQGISKLKQVNENGVVVQKPVPIIPVHQHPVLLDGAGGQAVRDPKTGLIPPTYLGFTTVKEKPFAKLFKNFRAPN